MVKEKSNETPTLEKLWHINPRKPLHPLPAAYTTLVIVMSETNPAILTQGKAPTRPNDDGPGGGLADYARAKLEAGVAGDCRRCCRMMDSKEVDAPLAEW